MHEVKAIRSLLPLLRRYRWTIPVVVSLSLLSSTLEGFGISLLIPFLQSFDPAEQSIGCLVNFQRRSA
jgi:ATP-binding cassette, subfamily B, bacterial MsbA